MPAQPLALLPALPSELLTYILTFKSRPTTLIICQSRAAFLDSLLGSIPQPSPTDDNDASSPPPESSQDSGSRHSLLVPTIHQVLKSRTVKLVFVPSVSHLRAYLAALPPTARLSSSKERELWKGNDSPSIVSYGIIGLHKDTSEWSAQGLGHSFAALIEAGQRSGSNIVVIEERQTVDEPEFLAGDEEISEEEVREGRRKEALKVWGDEVPMLSGGKSTGVEGGWSGRMVEVGRILSRWFTFAKGEWNEGL